ncbi:mucin-binding protein, partial [Limosilactobacillus ingluviei]
TDTAKGKFGQAIAFKVAPSQRISDYEGQHYILVGNIFKDNKYQADNQKNRFEVHFKHATTPISDTKTVTEIIHYTYANGSPAVGDKVQTVRFTRSGTTDLVDGVTTWQGWMPAAGHFASVDS